MPIVLTAITTTAVKIAAIPMVEVTGSVIVMGEFVDIFVH